jgi:hypothetical protein
MRNKNTLGEFTLSTTGGLNFYLGHNPDYANDPGLADADYGAAQRLRAKEHLTELQADRRLYQDAWRFIREHPGQTLRNTGYKLAVWLRPTVSFAAPTVLLIAILAFAACGRRGMKTQHKSTPRRILATVSAAALLPCLVLWLFMLWYTRQPWTTPYYVVPFGLVALALLKTKPSVRGLLAGIVTSQLLVALTFIPLVRLRWAIDGMLITALAVALAQLCHWLAHPSLDNADAPSTITETPSPGAPS